MADVLAGALPLLKTPMALSAIIVGLSNLNNLNVPSNLAGGGPGTSTMVVAIEIYRMSFTSYHFGESSALSIVLCLVNFPAYHFLHEGGEA